MELRWLSALLITRKVLTFPILLWWMGLQLEMESPLKLFAIRMGPNTLVPSVPFKEIFQVRLLFLGVH
ncbi:hypothetical protein AUC60_20645 [Pseudomonas caspiana]|uniref:Uncharacterized protein n=1 Tax=Pseudomonas caspiana TaxID=1451454 RepID=A0A1Y3P557_9PSED|nr:hypothetical protein AUC60_20645 [Pseudomonas caspiana]